MPDETAMHHDVQHYAVFTPGGAPIALSLADTAWRAKQNVCDAPFWLEKETKGYRCAPVVVVERDTYDRLGRELAAYKRAVGGSSWDCAQEITERVEQLMRESERHG